MSFDSSAFDSSAFDSGAFDGLEGTPPVTSGSAWGVSWLTSWGNSWGSGGTPPVEEERPYPGAAAPFGSADGLIRIRRKRRRREAELLLLGV